jgi:excisionase family DNA binding protein
MDTQGYRGDLAEGIMTVHGVAKYLRLSEAKIYQLARRGDLPGFRIGKTWRFNKVRIDEWILERTELTAVHPSLS